MLAVKCKNGKQQNNEIVAAAPAALRASVQRVASDIMGGFCARLVANACMAWSAQCRFRVSDHNFSRFTKAYAVLCTNKEYIFYLITQCTVLNILHSRKLIYTLNLNNSNLNIHIRYCFAWWKLQSQPQ